VGDNAGACLEGGDSVRTGQRGVPGLSETRTGRRGEDVALPTAECTRCTRKHTRPGLATSSYRARRARQGGKGGGGGGERRTDAVA
jgi:GTPase involved in cell partitioning and DNA repair